MNKHLKQFALVGAGTGLALAIAFGVVSTSFAQSTGSDQAQTQGERAGFVQRGGPGGMHRGGQGGFSPTVIADALGITEDELRTAFQDGKSVADLATEKGVSLDTIVNALIATESERLTQAVTDGKITQEEADQRLADLQSTLPDKLSQVPPARPEGMDPGGFGKGGRMGGAGSPMVIAETLGITEDDLRTAFQAGKSVADVAAEKGVSLDTVISAIVAAESEHLAQHVADGTLTQAEADQRLADLQSTLPDKLSQVPPARPEGMGPGGHGRHGGFDQDGTQNDDQPAAPQQAPDSNNGTSSSSNVAPVLQSENSNL